MLCGGTIKTSFLSKIIILTSFLFLLYALSFLSFVEATHTSVPIINTTILNQPHYNDEYLKIDGWVEYFGHPISNVFLDIIMSSNVNKYKHNSQIVGTIKSNTNGNFSFLISFTEAAEYKIKIISRCWQKHLNICENNESMNLSLTIENKETIKKNNSDSSDNKYPPQNNSKKDLFYYSKNSKDSNIYLNLITNTDQIENIFKGVCSSNLLSEKFILYLKKTFNIQKFFFVDRDLIIGTKYNDLICGNQKDNLIISEEGNDIILSQEGNDIIFSGLGNDTIYGREDVDRIFGGAGYDIINGGLGNDHLAGESGYDILYDQQGINTISGGKGFDSCSKANNSNCEFILR